MEDGILYQGLELLAAGMGTVFVFLTVLVIAMSLMSRILVSMHKAEPPAEVSDEEVAAITAAIAVHRRK
jgi:oxaloacetate decarboxylase gamma subunit